MTAKFEVKFSSIKDREAIYTENESTVIKEILFDFEFKNKFLTKGYLILHPESFSNWSNGKQEILSVYEYIRVIKRVINHFEVNYPNHIVLFGSQRKVG